ncbi:cleavage stimulation factor, 3' pre-RNA, subunit 1 [Dermatophagoides farinae]|uniref:Cleavage stimulation factor 50 kDa subunit n=1 Tax=Dermatophagoides farinae TaxID=6954 RepID=A0A922LAL8_DERFA|nr:cleavage stimulation factor, 3' pre-RNA, subunit 1 [Dermatophagoides farinae]
MFGEVTSSFQSSSSKTTTNVASNGNDGINNATSAEHGLRANQFHPGLNHDYRYRDQMYRLIISQLYYDGQAQLAKNISGVMGILDMCPPSDRLYQTVAQSLITAGEPPTKSSNNDSLYSSNDNMLTNGIDLDFETERQPSASSLAPSSYETIYVTSHKGPCRTGCFNYNGQLLATGSVDASIKILDVERMLAKSFIPINTNNTSSGQNEQQQQQQQPPPQQQEHNSDSHPVIRTLYDHMEEVSCLVFHPRDQFLISGSHDMTIKVFDYSKPSVKRACKSIRESNTIRCLALHPTGDYLLVGSQHPTIRLYHMPTFQSFISPVITDQHKGPITSICYAPNTQCYASSSKDGDIRIWDTVSNRCICVLPRAHEGLEICSLQYSRNGKYLLSSGKDSMVKLWELSMSRCLIAYTGAGQNAQKHRTQATFNHTEDFVMMPDEMSTSLCVWDARNAERQPLLALGHNQPVRQICHSPVGPCFITCSDDYRARFWYHRPPPTSE